MTEKFWETNVRSERNVCVCVNGACVCEREKEKSEREINTFWYCGGQ